MILHIIWDVVRCSLCFSTGYVLLTLRYPNVDSPVSRFFMVFRRRRERKNFISKICKIWKKKNKIMLNRVWLHNPYLMHSTSSTNSFQILAQDSENISVVWYLQRVTLRCCGVHGYYLDFLFLIYETRALFCCGSTRSIFTLHLSICLFFKKKKKKRNEDHHLHSEFIILSFFLAQFWWQKKKRTNRVWRSFFSQYAIVPNIFLSARSPGAIVFYLLFCQKGSF